MRRLIFQRGFWLRSIVVLMCVGAMMDLRSEEKFVAPVVIGFERFFFDPKSNPVEAGELLLSELRCVNCHQPDAVLKDRFPFHPGPVLEEIGSRVRFDHLIEWLASPASTKPGTTMPHLLSGKNEKARRNDATALAHFLFSLSRKTLPEVSIGSAARGCELFHSVGCVACHAPETGYKPPVDSEGIVQEMKIPSVPLGNLPRKYTSAGLNTFLNDPLAARPSGHMPRMPLSNEEIDDLTEYLLGGKTTSEKKPQLDPLLISRGRNLFNTLGCAACHPVSETTLPKYKSLFAIAGKNERGCLSKEPASGVPDYSLSPAQRKSLQAALKMIREPQTISIAKQIEHRMLALNCFVCHQRDGLGGPEPGRAIYFHTSGADLEDEGRFPPTLTGVGRKLLPTALEKILRGEGSVRPYMTTRMPDFGGQHAKMFSKLFSELDLTSDIKPTPRDGKEDMIGRSPWGRELAGINALNCISCHNLNGRKSLGISAIDLAHAPKRLRPEWFRDYLIDPAKFRPGTRMPSFWPDGKAVHPLIGGNTERQIDSLWVYLTEVDQNRLPEGMEEKGNFELKPNDTPIVFRTFMQEAGLHAIAVGFPEQIHAAFDAEKCRWALLWKGKFLDAEGTWDDRFAPLASPLGTEVYILPKSNGLSDKPQFRGYRLDAKGVPTFLYRAGLVAVEDTLKPDTSGKFFRRTIKFSDSSGRQVFRDHNDKLVDLEFDGRGCATLVLEVKW